MMHYNIELYYIIIVEIIIECTLVYSHDWFDKRLDSILQKEYKDTLFERSYSQVLWIIGGHMISEHSNDLVLGPVYGRGTFN